MKNIQISIGGKSVKPVSVDTVTVKKIIKLVDGPMAGKEYEWSYWPSYVEVVHSENDTHTVLTYYRQPDNTYKIGPDTPLVI